MVIPPIMSIAELTTSGVYGTFSRILLFFGAIATFPLKKKNEIKIKLKIKQNPGCGSWGMAA